MKTKVFNDNKNAIQAKIFLAVIVIGYFFFFTSNFTIPDAITPKPDVTKIEKQIGYGENRNVKVISACYSQNQKVAEIILQLENSNYDNVNDYYYAISLKGGKEKNTVIKQVINERLVTVLKIYNLKKFRELELYIAPKIGELEDVKNKDTVILTFNKYNITYKNLNLRKTKNDYMAERLKSTIATYELMQKNQKAKLEKLNEKIIALEEENTERERNKKYMTYIELTTSKERIQDNIITIAEINIEAKKEKEKISKNEKLIEEAENIIDSLE